MRDKRISGCAIIFAASGIIIWNHAFAQTDIRTVNGIQVVSNGRKPAPPPGIPTKIRLERDLILGTGSAPEEIFADIAAIAVDTDENIYVLDSKEIRIKVFDREGRFLRGFGRKGQGPGEFLKPTGLFLAPGNEIFVDDLVSRRIAVFSRGGNFLRHVSALTAAPRILFGMDSQGSLIGLAFDISGSTFFRRISKYSPELALLLTYDSVEMGNPWTSGLNMSENMIYGKIDPRDRLYSGGGTAYEIRIFAPDGKLVRKILKAYDPMRIPEEKKKDTAINIPEIKKSLKIVQPEFAPPFFGFTIDEDGRLIVMAARKSAGGGGYLFDVFDGEGRFISEIRLPVFPLLWKHKRLYGIEESEDGNPSLSRYRVTWER
jgi:6-bladed beta-propeller